MATIKNMPQLEYEMGNSRTMIKRNYDDRREEEEAIEYFGIYPGVRAPNVLTLAAAKEAAPDTNVSPMDCSESVPDFRQSA